MANRRNGETRTDAAIHKSFDWLVKRIYENDDALHKRVQQDVQVRNEAEQKAKQELEE